MEFIFLIIIIILVALFGLSGGDKSTDNAKNATHKAVSECQQERQQCLAKDQKPEQCKKLFPCDD